MHSSMSNNVDEVSPMEFRKLCNLLETIFAQTVSCEVYELFEERCCGCKLNRSIVRVSVLCYRMRRDRRCMIWKP